MEFIGQRHIREQLDFILPEIADKGSAAFLLRGPSGYGKTDLAMRMANYISGTNYSMKLGNVESFYPDVRVHLIDEIHLCPTIEEYYPLIDSRRYVFIFTTNEDSVLPEALVNRCYDFIFTDYSLDDLKRLVNSKSDINLRDEQLEYVIEFCNRNPRSILSIVQRLSMWQKYNVQLNLITLTEFKLVAERVFGVEDGIDILSRRYLEVLNNLGGRASLSAIRASLHVDEGTIKAQIEPALLYKNKIQITSRGRSLT